MGNTWGPRARRPLRGPLLPGPLLTGMGAALLDLALGSVCVLCGRPGTLQCWWCAQEMRELGTRFARGDDPPRLWLWPGADRDVAVPVWSAMPYRRPFSDLVVAYKEHAALSLAPTLAWQLRCGTLRALAAAESSRNARPSEIWLVPVPSRPGMSRRRGHDPTFTLARHAATLLRQAQVPTRAVRLLRSHSHVRDQVGLGVHERRANLLSSMQTVPHLLRRALSRLNADKPAEGRLNADKPAEGHFNADKPAEGRAPLLLVIDDVVTTGATLTEAARALEASGVRVMAAAAAGWTPPPGHRSSPWQS